MSYSIRYFHGTTLARAEVIKASGFDNNLRGDGLWLGSGIYFFENGFEHAKSWAINAAQKESGHPAIIESILRLENVVDLADRNHWDGVRAAYDALRLEGVGRYQSGPEVLLASEPVYRSETWKHYVDHAVMDSYLQEIDRLLASRGQRLDAVRCPFLSGRLIYDKSWFGRRSCNMIAIKNKNSIVENILRRLN